MGQRKEGILAPPRLVDLHAIAPARDGSNADPLRRIVVGKNELAPNAEIAPKPVDKPKPLVEKIDTPKPVETPVASRPSNAPSP